MNHNEIDHSGALPELLREIPGTPYLLYEEGRGHRFAVTIIRIGTT